MSLRRAYAPDTLRSDVELKCVSPDVVAEQVTIRLGWRFGHTGRSAHIVHYPVKNGALINIVAMLLVFVALVNLANAALGLLPEVAGSAVTLQRILGLAMAPLAWLAGIPWSEAPVAGQLLGTKTVLNELIAYLGLAALPEGAISPRSRLIMTYALCGFANLGSLGIMIGGLATMAPARREDIVRLGAKTLVSGTLATLIAGSVVGMLY